MRNIVRFVVSIIGLFYFFQVQALPRFEFDVKKTVLPNGITVLISENHTSPVVSYQSWFRTGSKDESPGKTGLAHLFEHLMFKGTQKYPERVFEKTLEQNGITHNAYTTQDYTVYFEDHPNDKLELVIDLESDRFKNLIVTPQVFESEKKVVQEERLMRSEQSLEGMMSEKLWALSFLKHPYKNPVIGWPQDIESLTLKDALDFFKKYYVPKNLVISIAGDVNVSQALELINKYYGEIKGETPEGYKPTKEESSVKEKKIEILRSVRSQRLLLGYRIGKAGDKESFALDLLAIIFAEGKTSRLYKKLFIENHLATTLSADAHTPMDDGIFEIEVQLKPGLGLDQTTAIVDSEVLKLQKTLVTPQELQKAKLKVYTETLSALRASHGRAQNLALNEVMTGNYKNLFDDIDQYNAVSAKDIQEAVQKYLNTGNRVRVELRSKP